MSNISIENNVYVFLDDKGNKKVLFDILNPFANKSKITTYNESNNNSLYGLLSGMSEKHDKIFKYHSENQVTSYFIIDGIFMANVIKSAVPLKVLELGCSNGQLSYHLTEILGKINNKSTICLVNDEINSNDNNIWLEAIGMATEQPEMSIVISDYDKTNLEKNSFDIVVINGEVDFDEPYKVLKEAERLTKKNGVIICYSCDNKNLKNAVCLIFSENNEYKISDDESVFVINYDGTSWTSDLNENWYNEMIEMINKTAKLFNSYPKLEDCREVNEKIKKYIKCAIMNNNIKLKIALIELKQNILDYMAHIEDEYKEYCFNEINKNLLSFLKNKTNL